jgi:hypothetical protein
MSGGDRMNSSTRVSAVGACGRLRLRLALPGIKWPRYSRTPALGPFARYLGYPQAHAQPGCEDKLDWANGWQNPARPLSFEMEKRTDADSSRVYPL